MRKVGDIITLQGTIERIEQRSTMVKNKKTGKMMKKFTGMVDYYIIPSVDLFSDDNHEIYVSEKEPMLTGVEVDIK